MPIKTKQDALVLVRTITTSRLAQDVGGGLDPDQIDIDLTFTGGTGKGYGRTPERYLHLCIVIADDLRASSGRDFYISVVFANDHESKPISDFIFDAATLLMEIKRAVLTASAAWAAAEIKNRK